MKVEVPREFQRCKMPLFILILLILETVHAFCVQEVSLEVSCSTCSHSSTMYELCLQLLEPLKDPTSAKLTLESFLALYTYVYCEKPENILLNFILQPNDSKLSIETNLSALEVHQTLQKWSDSCELPFITSANVVISGVCGVCRQIIKNSAPKFHELLGFRNGCLHSPSETSVWTKFCEIDIIGAISGLFRTEGDAMAPFIVPPEMAKFEVHLATPTKAHNYFKLARRIVKEQNPEMERVTLSFDELRIVEHRYAEGWSITLADLTLFASFSLLFERLERERMRSLVPLTLGWFELIEGQFETAFKELRSGRRELLEVQEFALPVVLNHSLYKIDGRKHKEITKRFTRQENIDISLEKLSEAKLAFSSENTSDEPPFFDWDALPVDVLPEQSKLPAKRVARKKYQLGNVAYETVELVKGGKIKTIVDFCSGTGHLGLLLAAALPNCHVILIENKEESIIKRARARAEKLKLQNVSFFQGNIDYFHGPFDLGVSLHACGVATDIVLNKCWAQRAAFICVPCCYGAIFQTHHITYPRSQKLQKAGISAQDYYYVAHCADQAHSEKIDRVNVEKARQGELCMDIIDTDRKLLAEELGYSVALKRLRPADCTPKNRLLVGQTL